MIPYHGLEEMVIMFKAVEINWIIIIFESVHAELKYNPLYKFGRRPLLVSGQTHSISDHRWMLNISGDITWL